MSEWQIQGWKCSENGCFSTFDGDLDPMWTGSVMCVIVALFNTLGRRYKNTRFLVNFVEWSAMGTAQRFVAPFRKQGHKVCTFNTVEGKAVMAG